MFFEFFSFIKLYFRRPIVKKLSTLINVYAL